MDMVEGARSLPRNRLMRNYLTLKQGKNRFADVETEATDNGNPILKDALAYVECSVESRMECGDHWLIYGVAKEGNLLGDGITAVHHRKSGSHY